MSRLPFLLIGVTALFAALSQPSVAEDSAEQKAKIDKSISNVRHLILACWQYSADNNGNYPADIEDLFTLGYFEKDKRPLLHCPLLNDDTQTGYEYYGKGLEDVAPDEKIIFLSKWKDADGRRIVGHSDKSVKLEVPKKENLPAK